MTYPEYYHLSIDSSKEKFNVTYSDMNLGSKTIRHYFITFTHEEFDKLCTAHGADIYDLYESRVKKIKITNMSTRQDRVFKFMGFIPKGVLEDRTGYVYTIESEDHMSLQII